ncbi:Tyrosinase_Cu-bd domain-containing protein [Meloidogyne graminicola]|uniref:Tyrosinase_Cu-bd domain-containing protein n=1 Tax=Meloidogyne graminicola TaxID=189291 RepID=A0A8S9ZKS3_9BILA|nr:Tyrosinase_Cu-bd domain-containing protein [Meloidogyne graminicola]
MLINKLCLLFILISINLFNNVFTLTNICEKAPDEQTKKVCNVMLEAMQNANENKDNNPFSIPGFAADSAADRPELKCLDLNCLCSEFGGTSNGSINDCTLPNGQKLTKAIRKEIRMLTFQERIDLFKAIRQMKDQGDYDYIAAIHRLAFESGAAHSGPTFCIWHREYIKRFEILLRKQNPSIVLPYWDSTMDGLLPHPPDSILFTDDFLGTTNSQGFVVTGPFSPWETLEYPHGNVHAFVGGDMFNFYPNSAANDFVFFLLHSFVDSDCEPTSHFRNATMTQFSPLQNWEGLKNEYTDNLYEYAPRPTCTYTTECESEWLFCDRSHGSPHCAAKARLGGNCTGFTNGEDVCMNSTCVNGICIVIETSTQQQTTLQSTTVKPTTKEASTIQTEILEPSEQIKLLTATTEQPTTLLTTTEQPTTLLTTTEQPTTLLTTTEQPTTLLTTTEQPTTLLTTNNIINNY